MAEAKFRATWRKSAIGYGPDIRATVRSLGFRKLNETRELPDNAAVRGMVSKISFLVSVEGESWEWPRRTKYKMWRKRSAKKHSKGH
jgi:large subunit ribosomal protein L30